MTGGRYALFAGDRYYPRGGWDDMRGRFGTATEACHQAARIRAALHELERDDSWWHVVDLEAGVVVAHHLSAPPKKTPA
jgi:hypothetical protein